MVQAVPGPQDVVGVRRWRVRCGLPTNQTLLGKMASMSPIRGDVKKKFSSFLSKRGRMLWLASSRTSVLERLRARRVFRTSQAVGGLHSTVS
jgi:hypothetical protein